MIVPHAPAGGLQIYMEIYIFGKYLDWGLSFFSAKSKLEYLMRKLSSYLLSVFVWEFYFKLKYFLSIVFITIQSFKTLIECHLRKDEQVGWRWQAVIKMFNVNNLQPQSDMADQKCQIMLLRIIRVEATLFIIHNILMRHLDTLD